MTIAEVTLWGKSIGAVTWDNVRGVAYFEYTPEFKKSAIELAPLHMPLSNTVYSFGALNRETFHGLPGLLADSLPDHFGNALIDAWLSREGIQKQDFDPVQRLCYIGQRAMGGLEFVPIIKSAKLNYEGDVDLGALISLANEVLAKRSSLDTSLDEFHKAQTIKQILQVGTSAGGARAKALIAWNPLNNKIRSGQADIKKGFEHWILKFDGIDQIQDKDVQDPQGYGLIEYVYHLMAKASGIHMMPCHLLEENGRSHFMTQRFDRTDTGQKIHMQSLCAIAHLDYNQAGAHSYEQAFDVMRQINLTPEDLEQLLRRAIFNILARNQDDHTKNIAFLMNKLGEWRLSPAYDLTYNYNAKGLWTCTHQMSINGKRDDFELDDIIALGKHASLSKKRTLIILSEVKAGIDSWKQLAEDADIKPEIIRMIQSMFRSIE